MGGVRWLSDSAQSCATSPVLCHRSLAFCLGTIMGDHVLDARKRGVSHRIIEKRFSCVREFSPHLPEGGRTSLLHILRSRHSHIHVQQSWFADAIYTNCLLSRSARAATAPTWQPRCSGSVPPPGSKSRARDRKRPA